ncbi:MAG: fructosamine kinase family protein [Polyangiaceae bacterium]
MISSALRSEVQRTLAQRIASVSRVSGGDINQAFALELADGQRVFLKSNDNAPPGMFGAEARGLAFLQQAQALRIPRVLSHSGGEHAEGPSYLLLEFIQSARPRAAFDEELGRGLAALHRAGAPCFGLDEPNFIGRLPQTNHPHGTWSEFYRVERLEAQLQLAVRAGRASSTLRRGLERLFSRLPELVGESEAPARLHGDLWGGNLHIDEQGAPCLIDPAVYGGHREMDLAMMRLFGGFGERVFAAYAEAFPLSAGHVERVGLYQLYPLLVHLNLFGGSYGDAVQRALTAYL